MNRLGRIIDRYGDYIRQECEKGRSNKSIARELGISFTSVGTIRAKFGIAPFVVPVPMLSLKKVKPFFDKGMADTDIAARFNCNKSTVRRLRIKAAIPPIDYSSWATKSYSQHSIMKPTADYLYAKIVDALRSNDPNIRDDAAQDLYVAVLSGEILESDIKRVADKFSGRVFAQYPTTSRFGERSLDETYDDSERSLYDRYASPDTEYAFDLALYHGLTALGVEITAMGA